MEWLVPFYQLTFATWTVDAHDKKEEEGGHTPNESCTTKHEEKFFSSSENEHEEKYQRLLKRNEQTHGRGESWQDDGPALKDHSRRLP